MTSLPARRSRAKNYYWARAPACNAVALWVGVASPFLFRSERRFAMHEKIFTEIIVCNVGSDGNRKTQDSFERDIHENQKIQTIGQQGNFPYYD